MDDAALALLVLAAALALGFAGLALYASGSSRRAALTDRSSAAERDTVLGLLAQRLDRGFRRTAPGRALEHRLQTGGVARSPLEFALGCLVAFLATWAVVSLVLRGALAVIAGLAAIAACLLWLGHRREQRALAFVAQLPEISRLVANGAAAGLSLPAAVEAAAGELEDPAGSELRRVVDEMRLGRPLDEALEALRLRLPSREVGVLLTTLIIQQRSGGDVVRALHDLGETLQARKETLREVRTILAGSVFSSWLVGVMAIGTLVLLNGINPGVIDEMTHEPVGLAALSAATALYLVGFLLIRRITRVDL